MANLLIFYKDSLFNTCCQGIIALSLDLGHAIAQNDGAKVGNIVGNLPGVFALQNGDGPFDPTMPDMTVPTTDLYYREAVAIARDYNVPVINYNGMIEPILRHTERTGSTVSEKLSAAPAKPPEHIGLVARIKQALRLG